LRDQRLLLAGVVMPLHQAATSAIGVGLETVCLDLGGACWLLRSFTEGLPLALDERISRFVSQPGKTPDATVQIHWASEFLDPGPALFDAGPWRAYSAGDGLQFDFFTPIIGPETYKRAIFAPDFNSGEVLLNRRLLEKLDSYYPFEYPLDELASMHRLAQGRGVELHCCGMKTSDGRGFLFVGHSGAGKSTLGKSWVAHRQAAILSDDRVIVTDGDNGFRIHGTPWHGEAGLAKNASADLRGIFLIQHGERNQTIALRPLVASVELLSRSFVPWYRPRDLDFTVAFLERVAESVPVYIFRCLPDVSAIEYLERHHAI
jgi:hypothetical protein